MAERKTRRRPKPLKDINEQAKLDEVPPVLLRRARISLGVIPTGSNGSTTWKLPELLITAEGGIGSAAVADGESIEQSCGRTSASEQKPPDPSTLVRPPTIVREIDASQAAEPVPPIKKVDVGWDDAAKPTIDELPPRAVGLAASTHPTSLNSEL